MRQACFPREQPEKWPDVLAKVQWAGEKKFTKAGCTALDRFNAEQNLECMISADEYYSKQQLEPPGSQASWNARDQHMVAMVMRVKDASASLFPKDSLEEHEEAERREAERRAEKRVRREIFFTASK